MIAYFAFKLVKGFLESFRKPVCYAPNERKFKNGFGFAIGAIADVLFLINSDYYNTTEFKVEKVVYGSYNISHLDDPYVRYEYSKYFLSYIRLGIEIRLKYVYFKYLECITRDDPVD